MKMKFLIYLMITFCLFGCSQKVEKIEPFIVTESGKKQYKNEDGILVKNDWVTVNGDKYYFDLNGYMLTDTWVLDEYYVGADGKMKTDFWYTDENDAGLNYYLDKDGKYVRDDVINLSNKRYAFKENGLWVKDDVFYNKSKDKYVLVDKNGIVIEKEGLNKFKDNEYFLDNEFYAVTNTWKDIDGKKVYFDENGKRVYKDFAVIEVVKSTDSEIKKWVYINEDGNIVKDDYVQVDGKYYCADKDGVLLTNAWDEYNGKKYYYGPECYMLTNQFIDNMYYVDENGVRVTNTQKKFNNNTYVFDSEGKFYIKSQKISKNGQWQIKRYINTGTQFLVNNEYIIGMIMTDKEGGVEKVNNCKVDVIVDKESIRFKIYNSKNNLLKYTGNGLYMNFDDDNYNYYDVSWDENGYICLGEMEKNKILISILNNKKINVFLIENFTYYTYGYGFTIKPEGFVEIYNSLE